MKVITTCSLAVANIVHDPVQHQVNEMMQQLNQQADYCASMGYACCSLLWRVSQQEQAVEAMLAKVTHTHSLSRHFINMTISLM